MSVADPGCRPIASLDHFMPEHLGSAQVVEEVATGVEKVVKVSLSNYVLCVFLSTNFVYHKEVWEL